MNDPAVAGDPAVFLTDGEATVTMAACLEASLRYAARLAAGRQEGSEPDQVDWESLFEVQSVAKKMQRRLGMPDEFFFQICATVFGCPAPEVRELLLEAQRRIGGRE